MVPKARVDFLSHPDTLDSIERLATAADMTLVVGAGVSAEARLPTWNELVVSLLKDAAQRLAPQLSGEDTDHWIDWVMATDGLLGAGTIVQNLLANDFLGILKQHLYRDSGPKPLPGPIAHQIARLLVSTSGSTEVITTNYDDLVESALRSRGIPQSEIRAYVTRKKPNSDDAYVVRHLHGILTDSQHRGTVVLSDADYYRMQAPNRWQEQHMQDRLENRSCLFMGTSLSDPNLLRYLFRSEGLHSSTVVFTRQGDTTWPPPSAAVRQAREDAAQVRWTEASVYPLYADYFSELAQFVYELALRKECLVAKTRYPTYRSRMTDWHNEMSQSLLQTRHLGRFRGIQDSIQEVLVELLDEVEMDVLGASGIRRGTGEKLAVHLWVHDPFDRTLVLWASSDRAWRDPTTLTPVPIRRPTSWVSAEAFCTGIPMTRSTAGDASSRWNHVTAVPVRLDDEPLKVAAGQDRWGYLPVGVATMASSHPEGSSVFSKADSDTRTALNQLLATVGGDILRPTT